MKGIITCMIVVLISTLAGQVMCCKDLVNTPSFIGIPGSGPPVTIGQRVGFECCLDVTVHTVQIYKKIKGNIKVVVKIAYNTSGVAYYFNANYTDNKIGFSCEVLQSNGIRVTKYNFGSKWYQVSFSGRLYSVPVSNISLTVKPNSLIHQPNGVITLTCISGEASPLPHIAWLQNGNTINSNISTSVTDGSYYYAKRTSQLDTVAKIELNGLQYKCVVTDNPAVSQTYTLQVAFPPDSSSLQPTQHSPKGRDEWHSLSCRVSGSNPLPTVEWWLDDIQLTGKEDDIEITPQHNMSTYRYNSPWIEGVLRILVSDTRIGKDIDCKVKYNQVYMTELAQSYTLQISSEVSVSSNTYIYVGAATGGTIALVAIITLVIICAHKRMKNKPKQNGSSTEDRYEYIIESSNLSIGKGKDKNKDDLQLPKQSTNNRQNNMARNNENYMTSGVELKSLSHLDFHGILYEGSYATVKYAIPKLQSGLNLQKKVAVKILKGNAKVYQRRFLQCQLQALYIIMKHENILEFLSFLDNKKSMALITEFYEAGDLQHFLRSQNGSHKLTSRDLIGMARDVASGMNYLSNHQPPFLHHQLSANHVLVGHRLQCKIFGFASVDSVQERDRCEVKHKLSIDIRWKAPELLQSTQQHSVQSDVWSFGVLMYEVASLGNPPYPGLAGDAAVKSYILDHQVMTRPVFVSGQFYEKMKQCWSWDIYNRPTFATLTSDLDYLQRDTQLHIDIERLMQPNISGHMRVAEKLNRKNIS